MVKTNVVIGQKIIKDKRLFLDSEFIKDGLVEGSVILCPKTTKIQLSGNYKLPLNKAVSVTADRAPNLRRANILE